MTYGHAAGLVQSGLRVDGSSTLVRVDTADIIRAAADRCDQLITRFAEKWPPHEGCGGQWQVVRGTPVPDRPGSTFALGKCTRCVASRDVVLTASGEVRGGPVFVPMPGGEQL